MDKFSHKSEISNLPQEQIRRLNTLCHILYQTITTSDEEKFFDGSAEVLRLCASFIKQSHFGKGMPPHCTEQALEYAIEMLQDSMAMAQVVSYDN